MPAYWCFCGLQACSAGSGHAQEETFGVHRGILGMPQRLPPPCAFLHDRDFFRGAWTSHRWNRGKWGQAIAVADSLPRKLARARIPGPNSRGVITRPTQTTRPVHPMATTMPTFHIEPPFRRGASVPQINQVMYVCTVYGSCGFCQGQIVKKYVNDYIWFIFKI